MYNWVVKVYFYGDTKLRNRITMVEAVDRESAIRSGKDKVFNELIAKFGFFDASAMFMNIEETTARRLLD